mmetsp:Transcript_12016/g.36142  ORF Transcript_12016/g.36142 Transcript_12016/m.36142 type:complete len:236 (+) Transcript_12016:1893-2600(+)
MKTISEVATSPSASRMKLSCTAPLEARARRANKRDATPRPYESLPRLSPSSRSWRALSAVATRPAVTTATAQHCGAEYCFLSSSVPTTRFAKSVPFLSAAYTDVGTFEARLTLEKKTYISPSDASTAWRRAGILRGCFDVSHRTDSAIPNAYSNSDIKSPLPLSRLFISSCGSCAAHPDTTNSAAKGSTDRDVRAWSEGGGASVLFAGVVGVAVERHSTGVVVVAERDSTGVVVL